MLEVRSSEINRNTPRKPRLSLNRQDGAFADQPPIFVYVRESIFLYYFLHNSMEKQSQSERFSLTSIGLSVNFLF
jgi:hypothetical protein